MTGDRDRQAAAPDDRNAAPAGPCWLEQAFDAGSLYALRAAVAAHSAAAGLSDHRAYDVTAVAHELAANAVLHGAGHGQLRLWTKDGHLYCQVSDDGPTDPGNGTSNQADHTAPWPAEHGHGLWLVGEVADGYSVEHGPARTTITARFTLSPPRKRR
jgi:anti-sigma regulatory factor (Ser/Thr protein kinase)